MINNDYPSSERKMSPFISFTLQRNYNNQKNQRKKYFYPQIAPFVEIIYIRKISFL
jgi:hypothetical protein